MIPRTFVFSLLLLLLANSFATCSDKPQPGTASEAEILKRIDKAAKTAEIYGIGIYRPDRIDFEDVDVTNWPQFVQLLQDNKGPATRVMQFLAKDRRELVENKNVVAQIAAKKPTPEFRGLTSDISHDICKMMMRPDLFSENDLNDVSLTKDLKDAIALGEKRTHIQTLCLNRSLLAAAFPNQVAPIPAHYYLTTVRVKAGKSVILVLTSYESCRWLIEVEEGGEVAAVILGGGAPQEVGGVSAPVLYLVANDPYKKPRAGDRIGIAYDVNSKEYAVQEEKIKSITGKPFTNFQGQNTAPQGGFIVKPNAK
ncbi:hypothetical protein VT84_13335 [Gemmata sp. SH-PL17]|uniref:hypothetical protein n=1 Tax=Gemmata sp. SH-PL17 TaxID=1630693 RepID=UPI00078D1151|nr:hypothetical protein [Gemmata sp. SH-PL17]AMV25378.1 hypothetical protein VT84_13335 [Gemmata sp. SH-PL17]